MSETRIHHLSTTQIVEKIVAAADALSEGGGITLTEQELRDLAVMIERDRTKPLQDYTAQSQRIAETCQRYGLKAGELQWQWRQGKRSDPRELEDAIVDALWMGCVPAHPGDGVGCASQIAGFQLKRAEEFKGLLADLIAAGDEGDGIGLASTVALARKKLSEDDARLASDE